METTSINIPDPKWDSDLADIILDLEKLRGKELYSEIPPYIFFQLKGIFQMLETLGSARIEGNNTTLSEYIEKIIEREQEKDTGNETESEREIENIELAIKFIEDNTNCDTKINRAYISEIHKIVTKGLTPPPYGEGSHSPGNLRKCNVKIKKSNHIPPDITVLQDYFLDFLAFINVNYKRQYQLLMIAIAHHRFSYVHPFDNGNGRMGRLLNYAFLIKMGFLKDNYRIINPSSIFYSDRDRYYDMLSNSDSLKDEDILKWSEYFLLGLKNEILKIDSLLDKRYVRDKILFPVINFALDRENITKQEFEILKLLISKDSISIKSEDLSEIGITNSTQKSRVMSGLKNKNIVIALKEGGRIYTINFLNNYLLRGIIATLKEEGFVSNFLNEN